MKLSYAITVCNEYEEIQRLVEFLLIHKRSQDEIIILYDHKNGDKRIVEWFTEYNKYSNIHFQIDLDFNNHFADWKNKLINYCSGDYIFQIDADEQPNEYLINILPYIIESNPDNEVYLVPRANIVDGLTENHINEWGWNVNKNGLVNWPDFQWRVWKNKPEIKWINKVHERLNGFKTYSTLPMDINFALHHHKTIERQEKQNSYYNTL